MTIAFETSNRQNTWAAMFPPSRQEPRLSVADHDQAGTAIGPRTVSTAVQPEKPVPPPHPYGLTNAELNVLEILAEGATNEQIALGRNCAVGTVKVHLGRIFRKFGVRNRGEAIVIARRLRAIQQALLERARGTPFKLDWILHHMTDEHHPAGAVLFHLDDHADALYFLQSGRIALPEVGATLSEGSVFGEIGIFSEDRRRTSSAVCSTPVRLFRVSAERVWEIYAENPSFAIHVLRLAASRLVGDRIRLRFPAP